MSAKVWLFLGSLFSCGAVLQGPISKITVFLGHPTWLALDPNPWPSSHIMLSKVLLSLSASLMPNLELANSPKRELHTLVLPPVLPFPPVLGLLILHSWVNYLMPPERWFLCFLQLSPHWEDWYKLPSLPWPSTSNFSSLSTVRLFFSHLRERNVPSSL